ncbi:hypothetical protein VCR15J2_470508 [Vibrio coralliirubri]|nr:hypothetical protein VCR15J2_470508 [Vibrio coralliirubri]
MVGCFRLNQLKNNVETSLVILSENCASYTHTASTAATEKLTTRFGDLFERTYRDLDAFYHCPPCYRCRCNYKFTDKIGKTYT